MRLAFAPVFTCVLACSVTLDPTRLAETPEGSHGGGAPSSPAGTGGTGGTSEGGDTQLPGAGSAATPAGGSVTTTTGGASAAGGVAGATSELPTCETVSSGAFEYWFCPEARTFAAAAESCSLLGAALVTIEDAAQNDWLAARAGRITSTNLWLGGARDEDLVWRWPSGAVFWRGGPDGMAEPGAFVRWQPGEPNDSSTVSAEPERCLAYTFQNHDWNDRACSLDLPFICQR